MERAFFVSLFGHGPTARGSAYHCAYLYRFIIHLFFHMKKFFLLALVAVSAQAARAQSIAAGTISLGGSIGYGRYSDTDERKVGGNTFTSKNTFSQFQFSPAIGYFFADNLAIGLNMSYVAQGTAQTNTGPGTSSPNALDPSTQFQVGPYVQYYKMLSEQFGVLGTLGAGYQSSFEQRRIGGNPNPNPNTTYDTKGSGYYAAITPGVIFFPVPKFGISASIGNIGYSKLDLKNSNDADGQSKSADNFGASFGLNQLLLGGTFYFGR